MKVRVWDLPTRLFHWCTVLCFLGLIVTGQTAGDAMVWHFRLGYALLALLLFRLVWGLMGGYWSRFSNFAASPASIWRYLKGGTHRPRSVGHNPLGSLSVFALLGLLLVQIAAGLMSDDEVFVSGPLVGKVPAAWVQKATFFHTEIGKVVLIALALLHFTAIVWYWLKDDENLVIAMVNGDKDVDTKVPSSRDDVRVRGLALLVFVMCCVAVAAMVWWAQTPTPGSM